MENYYKILGISSAATQEEVRRAYRVLARRYHPDVNPGKASEEKFKLIAHAYSVLYDSSKRKSYDADFEQEQKDSFGTHFERAHEAYRRQQASSTNSQRRPPGGAGRVRQPYSEQPPPKPEQRQSDPRPDPTASRTEADFVKLVRLSKKAFNDTRKRVVSRFRPGKSSAPDGATSVAQLAIIEVSVSILDAIQGIRKTVELSDGTYQKKISVTIPPGVRSGSVVRFRRKENAGEEVVLIVRVAAHPILSMSQKGLVVQVPLSIGEAIKGTKLRVPTLDEEVQVNVPAGTQSGNELRLKGQGVQFRDGTRGDLILRFMIRVPDGFDASDLKEKSSEIDKYYTKSVRHGFPKNLREA